MTKDSTGRGRRMSRAAVTDWLVALGLLALLGWLELHTPAFTDYEVESEAAVQALLRGELAESVRLMPIYGGSIYFQAPFAWVAKLLGGGDIAIYRALAVSGALGVAALAALAAAWMRERGQERRWQLLAVALIATSPAIALAWMYGHHEEVLVAAAAVAGIIVATGGTRRMWVAGGILVGLAAGAKMSAVLAIPVAMVAALSVRAAVTVGVSAAISGFALLAPLLVAKGDALTNQAVEAGSGGIFKAGNLFWWFAERNPGYDPEAQSAAVGGTNPGLTYSRITPDFVGDHAHEAIILLGALLAAVWWFKHRRFDDRISLPSGDRRAALAASVLVLFAAVVWWRALIDPWFQAYYLAPALLALALAEAARGRVPVASVVGWAGLWLTWGEYAPVAGWSQDALSAVSLVWMVPFGIWLTVVALRGPLPLGEPAAPLPRPSGDEAPAEPSRVNQPTHA